MISLRTNNSQDKRKLEVLARQYIKKEQKYNSEKYNIFINKFQIFINNYNKVNIIKKLVLQGFLTILVRKAENFYFIQIIG